MTAMPQLVAALHSFVGMAAVLVAIALQFGREGRRSEALFDSLSRITDDNQQLNLSVRVTGDDSELSAHFNDFMDAISGALESARGAAVDLARNAAELKQTATENAQGAQAQQVSSTHAATAINEVAHSAEDVSGNARLAQEAADHAAEQTETGSSVVNAARGAARAASERHIIGRRDEAGDDMLRSGFLEGYGQIVAFHRLDDGARRFCLEGGDKGLVAVQGDDPPQGLRLKQINSIDSKC